tara:strand:- start:354 stop:1691 length:1338 start_codon:yes stop_codon:yes gene_type:complete
VNTRREFLRVGGLGAAGLSLPRLLASERSGKGARADSCIIIFLNGGAPHLDMWDMKPDAPREIRGEFSPIRSSVPGLQVCELLPKLAKQMHHTTLVRSMHHSVNNSHAAAVYAALTGHDRGEFGGGFRPDDYPGIGSVMTKLRPPRRNALPYVALPYKTQEGAGGPLQPGFLAGFIGAQYDPFWVLENPNKPDFRVRNLSLPAGVSPGRMNQRGTLLRTLDQALTQKLPSGRTHHEAMTEFQKRAFDLLTSNAARQAFQLEHEPANTRDAYGRNIYGQSVLLARRLIEAGTRVVTMSWAPDANATWDTHTANFKKLRGSLLPQFDAACASLIADLHDRRLLDRTIVAVLGDFGRTPKINNKQAGRDHWNACYSILLAGGGFKGGHIHGASDRTGSLPATAPVTPGDIVATLYQQLGLDHRTELYDSLERPHALVPKARVVDELLV